MEKQEDIERLVMQSLGAILAQAMLDEYEPEKEKTVTETTGGFISMDVLKLDLAMASLKTGNDQPLKDAINSLVRKRLVEWRKEEQKILFRIKIK